MKGYVLKLAKIAFKYVISELLFAGSLSPLYVKKKFITTVVVVVMMMKMIIRKC